MNMKERDFNKKKLKNTLCEKLNKTDLKNIFVFRDLVDVQKNDVQKI